MNEEEKKTHIGGLVQGNWGFRLGYWDMGREEVDRVGILRGVGEIRGEREVEVRIGWELRKGGMRKWI